MDTNSTVNVAPVNITITAPPEVFNVSNGEVGYVLTFYSTPNLFQVKAPEGVNKSDFEFVADSAVVGLIINRNNTELTDLTEPIIITLQSLRALRGEVYMCHFKFRLACDNYEFGTFCYRIGPCLSVCHGISVLLMVQIIAFIIRH